MKRKCRKLLNDPQSFFLDAIANRLEPRIRSEQLRNIANSKPNNTKATISLGWAQEHLLATTAIREWTQLREEKSARVHLITNVPFWRESLGNHKRIITIVEMFNPSNVTIIYTSKLTFYDVKKFSSRFPKTKLTSPITAINILSLENEQTLTTLKAQEEMEKSYRDMFNNHPAQIVICEYITTAFMIRNLPKNVTTILDTHDVMSKRQERYEENGRRHHIEISKEDEAKIYDRFDCVVAIQRNEASLIQSMSQKPKIITTYHPIEGNNLFKYRHPKRIGYIGGTNPANVDSIRWFLDEVWIRFQNSEIQLHIYGTIGSAIEEYRRKFVNIFIHGAIEDSYEVYVSSDIVINPVLYGGGLKIKTVEALGHGLPLVTTSAGADGLEEHQARAFIIADEPKAFASSIRDLLNRSELRRKLSRNALLLKRSGYSAADCLRPLRTYLEEKVPSLGIESERNSTGGTLPPKILERLLILSRADLVLVSGLKQYFDQFAQLVFRSPTEFSTSSLDRFLTNQCIDRVFVFNPYINDALLRLYRHLREVEFPIIAFDRGALPNSWFFDPHGFNADSNSYNRNLWQRKLTMEQNNTVLEYLSRLRTGKVTLEEQRTSVGAERIRKKYGLGKRVVIFVPFQRPKDVVIRYFSEECGGYNGFIKSLKTVVQMVRSDQYIILGKKHPLEIETPNIDMRFVDEDENIHDVIEASDIVVTINSGVGLLGLCHGKKVICSGNSFYCGEGLAVHCPKALDIVNEVQSHNRNGVTNQTIQFVHYLINELYSFGVSDSYIRVNSQGEHERITTDIKFEKGSWLDNK